MGRKRKYANAAERLKAFRARTGQQQATPDLTPVAPLPSSRRKLSRPARLLHLENEAQTLLDELQTWRESMPESLQDSRLAAKLDDAIDQFTEVAEALSAIDLPKGYGRD